MGRQRCPHVRYSDIYYFAILVVLPAAARGPRRGGRKVQDYYRFRVGLSFGLILCAHYGDVNAMYSCTNQLERFQRKLGPAGPAALALPHTAIFHPWVCDVFGDLHPTMAADIKGLAECIARGTRGRAPSAAASASRASSVENRLLVGLSFTRQRLLLHFFEERLSSCT